MNNAGYQEVFPKPPTCRACAEVHPHGCNDCRKEIQDEQEPQRLYVGSGEDMREWSLA